jgi:NADPH:quinone reductase-like Zn-dependent oxidoreductase
MRAYRLEKPGSVDGLVLADERERSPDPGEALVRVLATSLNYRDLMVLRGTYTRGILKPRLIPLSDGAGEVVAVGPNVARVKVGDRVAGAFMQRWQGGAVGEDAINSSMGGAIDGMLAETVTLHEDGLVHLPPHLSYEEGATLPCAAVTAWSGLVVHGAVKAGDTVLTQGTGGVSLFAVQFAKLLGARVIATTSSEEKAKRLRALGADEVVNYKTTPDWETAARKLTAGRGVDHVIEVGGAGTLAQSLQAARVGGRVSLIGVLTGAAEINPMPILGRCLAVQGVYVGSRETFEAMNRAITQHRLQPTVDRVFPFAAARDAYRYFDSRAHMGKVVIAHG